jgi:PhoD-like phosphatase
VGNRRITRRALLAAAAAVAVGGAAAARVLLSGDDSSICEGFEPVGWGPRWVAPHWQSLGTCSQGRALALPDGSAGAAADQPIPVFMQDRDLVTGQIDMAFKTSGDQIRPGVLFGAIAPYVFRGVTLERNRLVLADYGREQRRVLASAPAEPLRAGAEIRLRVVVEAAQVRAALGDEAGWRLSAQVPARRGAPGVLAVHPLDLEQVDLVVSSFEVRPDGGFGATPPVCPVASAGTPVAEPDGAYSARIQAWSAWPASVVFEWSGSADMSGAETHPAIALGEQPFVARATVRATDGKPVYWRARLRSRTSDLETVTPVHELRPPPSDRPLVLLAASCAQLVGPPPNRGLDRLRAASPEQPALLVYQGDLGYANNTSHAAYAARADFFADRFQRLLARPDFADVRLRTPVGTTLDDHDYGPPNNADRKTVAPWAIDLWNRIHADPSNRGYFDTRFGDVHCLTLDVRRYADSPSAPDGPAKTRLGAEQFSWMEKLLQESDARLFVVFSAGTFARRANSKGQNVEDTFIFGWPDEYRRTMSLFTALQSEGRRVLIVSGDAHSMRIHHHPDPLSGLDSPTPVIEFICAGLRALLWSGAPEDDPTVDPERNVLRHSGAGMVVVDPPGASSRGITLRAIGARDDGPVDLFPQLRLPFSPG